LAITWTAFPLHPETPEEGRSLSDLFASRLDEYNQMKAHFRQVAQAEGLPLSDRDMTYNSRMAQELGKWAESRGKGDAFHDEAFRAYFVDGKNIAMTSVLTDMAVAVGLTEEEALKVMDERTFQEPVDRDWARSRQMGITAVPTFVMNHEGLVGAQPYNVLEEFVRTNLAKA
jgi:predicted DsbA family dithiol-disulfide isomerase